METIIKYRFDKEMVAFVKKLDIKTAMFGYDKGDVYSKFKDLLIKARDVCEELVIEEHQNVEKMKSQLIEAAEDPSKLEALLAQWKSEAKSTEELVAEEASLEDSPESKENSDAFEKTELRESLPETEQTVEDTVDQVAGRTINQASEQATDQITDHVADQVAEQADEQVTEQGATVVATVEDSVITEKFAELEETYRALLEEHENLTGKLSETTWKLEDLETQLGVYKEREEELSRTADILREARLEGEAIVSSARTRAEQELFLYRAKRRDEEKAFEEVIKGMEAKKANLAETCALYRGYVEEGQELFDQLREYANCFERPAMTKNTTSENLSTHSTMGSYPIIPESEGNAQFLEENEGNVHLPWEAQDDIPYCEGEVCLFDADTRENGLDHVWELNEQALDQSTERDFSQPVDADAKVDEAVSTLSESHESWEAAETGPYCEGDVCSFDADRDNPQHEKLWSTEGDSK